MKTNVTKIITLSVALTAITCYACNTTDTPLCETASSGTDSQGNNWTTTSGQNLDQCDSAPPFLGGFDSCSSEAPTTCTWNETIDYGTGPHTVPESSPYTPTYASGSVCFGG